LMIHYILKQKYTILQQKQKKWTIYISKIYF
jgi:hypothetical protein